MRPFRRWASRSATAGSRSACRKERIRGRTRVRVAYPVRRGEGLDRVRESTSSRTRSSGTRTTPTGATAGSASRRSVSVPGERVHLCRRLHDRRAPDPRLGGAGRPEPPAARCEGARRRPQPADRRLPVRVRALAPPTTRGSPPAGPSTASGRSNGRRQRDDPGQGHPLRALHGAPWERAQGTRRPRVGERRLQGEVTLAWDDEVTSREALLAAMMRGGFSEVRNRSRESRLNGNLRTRGLVIPIARVAAG